MEEVLSDAEIKKVQNIEIIREYISECSRSYTNELIPEKIIIKNDTGNQKTVKYLVVMGDLIFNNTSNTIENHSLIHNYWLAAACGSADTLLKLSNMLQDGVYMEKNQHLSQILMIAALDRGCNPQGKVITTLEHFTFDEIRQGIEISHLTKHNLETYKQITPKLSEKLLEQFNEILKEDEFIEPTLPVDILGKNTETDNNSCCIIL